MVCNRLGWKYLNCSIGGTGYLATGVNSIVFRDRLLPPVNAWRFYQRQSTGGTFSVSQGGQTTTAIASTAPIATIQTAFDAAFGTGVFVIAGDSALAFVAIGRGANANVAGALTVTSSLTGLAFYLLERYLGDIAPQVPIDANGLLLPFNIVLAGCRNDNTGTNAGFTPATLQAEVGSLIDALKVAYPTATIYVIGGMYLPGGAVPQVITDADAAIATASTAHLTRVNGHVPFVSTLTAGIVTGTGFQGSLAGNGNSDICCISDGVHPTVYGHEVFGTYIAEKFLEIQHAS